MKAEISDAPARIIRRGHKRSVLSMVVCLVIGSVVTIGVLLLVSRALSNGQQRVEPYRGSMLMDTTNPRSAQVSIGEVIRTTVLPPRPDSAYPQLRSSSDIGVPTNTARQTVFNDQNFIPGGAHNIITLHESSDSNSPAELPQKVKLTIVQQTLSMKERACWPFKQGSIEFRNCRSSVGLRYRE